MPHIEVSEETRQRFDEMFGKVKELEVEDGGDLTEDGFVTLLLDTFEDDDSDDDE